MSQLNRIEEEQAAVGAATKEIRAYIDAIVDPSSFVQLNAFAVGRDRLDGAPIVGEGVLCGTATIRHASVVIIAQNAAALYGSFGEMQADKICRAFDLAEKRGIPVISVLDSAGARVGEDIRLLEGYGSVLRHVGRYHNQNGMHICVIKGQAVGMFAAYAALADLRIMQKDAIMSVAAPAVIAAKTGKAHALETSADANAKAGDVDFVCGDGQAVSDLVASLWRWLSFVDTEDDPNRESPVLSADRSVDALLSALADDGAAQEYRAEQKGAARCFMAHINGLPVGVLACDYDAARYMSAGDLKKARDFISLLYQTDVTLVTLVNSDGAEDKEHLGLAESMSRIAGYLADDKMRKIAVCVGHAVGAAYVLLASKGIGYDYTLAFPDSILAPVAPQAAVHLMYADVLKEKGNSPETQAQLAEMYASEHCDAFNAARQGVIDEVIDPATLRPYVANALLLLGADE